MLPKWGILVENVLIKNRATRVLLTFLGVKIDTPGKVYRMTFVVRSKNKTCDEKEGNFYGKAKNKNQAKGI